MICCSKISESRLDFGILVSLQKAVVDQPCIFDLYRQKSKRGFLDGFERLQRIGIDDFGIIDLRIIGRKKDSPHFREDFGGILLAVADQPAGELKAFPKHRGSLSRGGT
jgi:hypothetical protein